MLDIKKKIESVMKSEDGIPVSPLASLLFVVSALYGAAQKLRASGYRQNIFRSQKLPCNVISVGNIAVGCTGSYLLSRHSRQSRGQRTSLANRFDGR